MRKKLLITAGILVGLVAAGGVGFRAYRGPVGTAGLPADGTPEFTSMEGSRWVGEPTSLAKQKGEVVFVEGWSPG